MGLGDIVSWIVFGLVAGAIARFLHPGRDPMGWVGTIVLGVVGSVIGGGIAYLLHLGNRPFAPAGMLLSIIGAIILLSGGWVSSRRRMVR